MDELQVIREKLNEVINMDVLEKTLSIDCGLSGYNLKGGLTKEFILDIYNKYQGNDYRMSLNGNYEEVLKNGMKKSFIVYSKEEVVIFALECYVKHYNLDKTSEADHIIANIYRELLSDLVNDREFDCGVVGELLKSLQPDLSRLEEYQNKLNISVDHQNNSYGINELCSEEVIKYLKIGLFDISNFTFAKDNNVVIINFYGSQKRIECEINVLNKDAVKVIKWKSCNFDENDDIKQTNNGFESTGDEELFYEIINAAIIKVKNMYEIKDTLELKKDNN